MWTLYGIGKKRWDDWVNESGYNKVMLRKLLSEDMVKIKRDGGVSTGDILL